MIVREGERSEVRNTMRKRASERARRRRERESERERQREKANKPSRKEQEAGKLSFCTKEARRDNIAVFRVFN